MRPRAAAAGGGAVRAVVGLDLVRHSGLWVAVQGGGGAVVSAAGLYEWRPERTGAEPALALNCMGGAHGTEKASARPLVLELRWSGPGQGHPAE